MKILLGTDASLPARSAVELVARAGWTPATTVSVVAIDYAFGAHRRQLTDHLDDVAGRMAAAGLEVEVRLLTGRAGSILVDQSRNADLVVLGNRARSGIGSILLGSVSAEVVERGRCSVLVARGTTVERLLVAVDGSAASRHVAGLLCAAGAFEGSRALAVAVSRDRDPWPPSLDLQAARTATRVAARLNQCGIIAAREILHGDPAEEILERATSLGADLIAVGSRGRGGLRRLLLGSVARNVTLYAPCSVLVARRGVRA